MDGDGEKREEGGTDRMEGVSVCVCVCVCACVCLSVCGGESVWCVLSGWERRGGRSGGGWGKCLHACVVLDCAGMGVCRPPERCVCVCVCVLACRYTV